MKDSLNRKDELYNSLADMFVEKGWHFSSKEEANYIAQVYCLDWFTAASTEQIEADNLKQYDKNNILTRLGRMYCRLLKL